ncbi:MAG: 23S rRNA (adenine(2503)-C(2))-methyltransferase RlmN [Pirellulales bacterium]
MIDRSNFVSFTSSQALGRTPLFHLLEPVSNPLAGWLAERGLPAYRAAQIRRWVFEKRAADFAEMTDLPLELRTQLAADFQVFSTEIAACHKSADDTEKLLLKLADGERVECVLIREGSRRTICISTQVGCAMGCVFCASGLDGVVRNLTSGEIVEQMLRLARLLADRQRVTHIVVMGMGEPLANLDRLLPALDEATSPTGLGIGARRITVSTVGLPPAIRRLADRNCPYHLAISLHAPDDALRNVLVPANRNVGIAAIMEAADYYFQVSGRRLTFEYVLLAGVNDRTEHARSLAALVRGRTALVNLIPYNPIAGLEFKTPSNDAVARFEEILQQGGVPVQIRRRKGEKIEAACGQLRRLRRET